MLAADENHVICALCNFLCQHNTKIWPPSINMVRVKSFIHIGALVLLLKLMSITHRGETE